MNSVMTPPCHRRWTDCLLSRGLELATIAAWHGVWSLADLWAAQQICQVGQYKISTRQL